MDRFEFIKIHSDNYKAGLIDNKNNVAVGFIIIDADVASIRFSSPMNLTAREYARLICQVREEFQVNFAHLG